MAIYEVAYCLREHVDAILDLPYPQFVDWQEYFRLRPPGWRDDHRTVVQLGAWGVEDAHKAFPSLDNPYRQGVRDPNKRKFDAADLKKSSLIAALQATTGIPFDLEGGNADQVQTQTD